MDTNQVVLIDDVFDIILYHADLPDLFNLCYTHKAICYKKGYLFQDIFKSWFPTMLLKPSTYSWLQWLWICFQLSLLLQWTPLHSYTINQLWKLQKLDLSGNQLTTLPAAIGQLQHLQVLWLNRNQLTTLPAAIGQLQNLHRLYLSVNQLTTLPDAMG